jgi:hypothetical protein
VFEPQVWHEAGTFRVVCVAKVADAVYVLYCFQKKTQQTAKRDIYRAKKGLKDLLKEIAPRPTSKNSPAQGMPLQTPAGSGQHAGALSFDDESVRGHS